MKSDTFSALTEKGLSPEEAANESQCQNTPIYECLACGTTFKETDGEYPCGYLACPSCWNRDLREVK